MAHSHHIPSERDRELLSAYLDGELAGREKEVLEQRLAHEILLRKELDDLRATIALLSNLPRLKAPRDFTLDPAAGRPRWWTRLFNVGSPLELTGALGAVASLAVIVIAVLLSQTTTTDKALEDEPQAASVALHGTRTPAESDLGMTTPSMPAPEGTPIVYAGEEIESTLYMQSTVWAGTPFSTPAAAPTRTLTITPELPPQAPEAEGFFAQSEVGEAASEAEQPAPAESGAAPPAPAGAAAAPEDDGAAQDAISPTQVPPAANQAMTMMDEGADAEEVTSDAMQPETALRDAPDTSGGTTATGDISDTDSAERLEAEPAYTPTSEAASTEIAQAASDRPSEKSRAEQRQTSDRDLWWLAGLGAVLLAFSVALILIGRRKAPRS